MASTRRLAAILAADVACYSRLMGSDEEGTLERFKAHLVELVDPKIREHHGRVVKNTGDGVLAEFVSVVDALRCATAVQAGMTERNAAAPADQRIEFRIGIHQGDVVAEDHDIFGDAVNVAARLEALAEPGGICVSARVRGDAAGKLDLAFEDFGQQQLKNIARPMRVYAWRPKRVADPSGSRTPPASPISQTIAAPRLSIVVLPFANLGNDPDQQYFSDGITEDLTTDLSRIPNMLVISRNTAFTYRSKPVNTKQIGRELGVRYVMEGSVRRSGNRVRANAQLIDAETDVHLWAERFDGDTSDLFALQDEITSRISVALNTELIRAEAARPTAHPDAQDYILRARAISYNQTITRDSYLRAISLYECALALDPQSVEAQCRLASTLTGRVVDDLTDSRAADVARAEELSSRAFAASPRSALALYAKGSVLRVQHRLADAISYFEAVISLDRNEVGAHSHVIWCKLLTGPIEEIIPLVEQIIRLSPRDRRIAVWYYWIGRVHLLQSRTEEAIFWFERARATNPELAFVHAYLASAYALNGEIERAATELANAQSLSADGRYASIARLKTTQYFGLPKIRALFEATYFVGLRDAGMPEE